MFLLYWATLASVTPPTCTACVIGANIAGGPIVDVVICAVSGVLTKDSMAKFFGIPVERISDFVTFDPANAIKFTIYRTRPNGSPGDWDILGCQQYGPLLELEIP